MALKPTTQIMVNVAKATRLKYKKQHPLESVASSKAGKSYARKQKKIRKAMADRYRSIRNNPDEGPHIARVYMRAGGPGL